VGVTVGKKVGALKKEKKSLSVTGRGLRRKDTREKVGDWRASTRSLEVVTLLLKKLGRNEVSRERKKRGRRKRGKT